MKHYAYIKTERQKPKAENTVMCMDSMWAFSCWLCQKIKMH